jgi:uroporphyrinogen-III synthase
MKTSSAAYSVPARTIVPARLVNPHAVLTEESDLAFLARMASRMSAATPLDEVLGEALDFLATVVPCDSCLIYILEGDEVVLRASRNPHPEVIDRLKLGQGITGWVAQHRELVAIDQGAHNDPRFQLFNEPPEDRFEAFLSVPAVSGGRLVGLMNVQSRAEHRYSKRETSLAVTLGFLTGAAIDRARLESENLRLSDQLESRKILERAKGILQRDLNLSEEDAYLTLQRESRQRRKTIKEVASAIILSDDLKRAK